MKLSASLPDGVTVDGRFYKLDFDFRNVLRMMDELDRDDLMPEAREYRALRCLTKHPKNVKKVLMAVRLLLFREKPNKNAHKITDFEQDAYMIRAAFKQAYGIDLWRDKLHWIEFSDLLNAIPEGSRYAEVIGIRARPIPSATKYNSAEREWLIKAKANCALKLTEKEQAEKYNQDVGNIFEGLLNYYHKGSDT